MGRMDAGEEGGRGEGTEASSLKLVLVVAS